SNLYIHFTSSLVSMLMVPRSPRFTLFPYTTLFRSVQELPRRRECSRAGLGTPRFCSRLFLHTPGPPSMSKVSKTEKHQEEQLWQELKQVRAGMLGIDGSHSHLQPMHHMADPETGVPWFFTSRSSALARELGGAAHARFCIMGKGQD